MDDLLIAGSDIPAITCKERTAAETERFEMEECGQAKYSLELEIIRDHKAQTLKFRQSIYAGNVLPRFETDECKAVSTPMQS